MLISGLGRHLPSVPPPLRPTHSTPWVTSERRGWTRPEPAPRRPGAELAAGPDQRRGWGVRGGDSAGKGVSEPSAKVGRCPAGSEKPFRPQAEPEGRDCHWLKRRVDSGGAKIAIQDCLVLACRCWMKGVWCVLHPQTPACGTSGRILYAFLAGSRVALSRAHWRGIILRLFSKYLFDVYLK